MVLSELKAEGFYWARRFGEEIVNVVQISAVFGSEPEFLTVAIVGSEQHFVLEDFEFIAAIARPNNR